MADVVGGEIFGGLEIDANEVADRVVVLDAVKPADRDAAGVTDGGAVGFVHDGADAFEEAGDLGIGRSRPLGGGHLPFVDHLQSLLPDFPVFQECGLVVVDVEDQVRLLRLDAVAFDAVVGQE